MKWVKDGPLSMVSGDWRVTKFHVFAIPTYVLWKGEKRMGQFQSFDEAKAIAEMAEMRGGCSVKTCTDMTPNG